MYTNTKTGNIISNFHNYYIPRGELHNLDLRNNNDLDQVLYSREHGRTAVKRVGSVYWNKLPEAIKAENPSPTVFKSSVFKHFISLYND